MLAALADRHIDERTRSTQVRGQDRHYDDLDSGWAGTRAGPERRARAPPHALERVTHKPVSAEAVVSVTLGMVGCYVDKAFNREVDRLRRGGTRKAEAEEIAEADDRLDRWIVVSPIVQADAVSADLAAIECAEAVGLQAVPASPNRSINQPGVVDLGLRFSTDRKLCTRVATISQDGADEVRMAMLRLDLARTGGFADLEALVGAKLADIEVDERHPLKVRCASATASSSWSPPRRRPRR